MQWLARFVACRKAYETAAKRPQRSKQRTVLPRAFLSPATAARIVVELLANTGRGEQLAVVVGIEKAREAECQACSNGKPEDGIAGRGAVSGCGC